MKKQWIYVIVALIVVGAIGYGVAKKGGGDVKIGANFELTGGVASFGQSALNAIKLAIDDANANGGVLGGKKIKLVEADNKSDNAEATNMATKLVTKDKVVALLGPVTSGNSIAAGNVAQSLKVPMLSPTATNPDVTKIGEYVFRACFLDDFQGRSMAQFAYNDLKSRKAAIFVSAGDPYSTGLAQYFKERYTALGGKIVAEEKYQSGDTEFRPQLTKIKSSKADLVYVPGYYQEQGAITRQAREMGLNVPLTGGDGWDSAKLVEIAGASNLTNIFYTNHYTPSDKSENVQAFVNAYKAKYGAVPDALAALGYDAARMLIDAINRAGAADPEKIREALAATEGFQGLGSVITMGADRNPIKDAVIVELKNGEQLLRATVKP